MDCGIGIVEVTWKSTATTRKDCIDYQSVLHEMADLYNSASQESFRELRILPIEEIENIKKPG